MALPRGRRVITSSFSLADTTNCSRTHNDLSLDNAKDVAPPCGCILGRRDLHLFVSTAASSELCGCPCVAFSSDHVTLAGEGCRVWHPACACVCIMCRASGPNDAFSAPHPRDPDSSLPVYPNPCIFPLRPLGSKFLSLSQKAKTPFEENRRGRCSSLSSHFPSWLNLDDSNRLQSIYLADLAHRLPGGLHLWICPSRGSMWS